MKYHDIKHNNIHHVEHNGKYFYYMEACDIEFKKSTPNKISPQEYIDRINNIDTVMIVLGYVIRSGEEYKGNVTKVLLWNGDYFQTQTVNSILKAGISSIPKYNEYIFESLKSKEQHDIILLKHKNEVSTLKHLECGTEWTTKKLRRFFSNNSHCPFCMLKLRKAYKDEFLEKSKKLYDGKYDYTNVDYIDKGTEVDIVCDKHGIFKTTPKKHLLDRELGAGCPECKISLLRPIKTEKFIIKANNVHSGKYTYSDTEYIDVGTKVLITCSVHGNFYQNPVIHLSGSGCPGCAHGGFDSTKDAILYLHKIVKDDEVYYKFGITNNHTRRLSEQNKNFLKPEVYKIFSSPNGLEILELESKIKRLDIKRKTLTKEEFEDGYTETFHSTHLETVLEFIYNEIDGTNIILLDSTK